MNRSTVSDGKIIVSWVGITDSNGMVPAPKLCLCVLKQGSPLELMAFSPRLEDGKVFLDDQKYHRYKHVGYDMLRAYDSLTGETLRHRGMGKYFNKAGDTIFRRDVTFEPWSVEEVKEQMNLLRRQQTPTVDYDVKYVSGLIESGICVTKEDQDLDYFLSIAFPAMHDRGMMESPMALPNFYVASDSLVELDRKFVESKVLEYVKGLWTPLVLQAPKEGFIGKDQDATITDHYLCQVGQEGKDDLVMLIVKDLKHRKHHQSGTELVEGQVLSVLNEDGADGSKQYDVATFDQAKSWLGDEYDWVVEQITQHVRLNDNRIGGKKYCYSLECLSRVPRDGLLFANLTNVPEIQVIPSFDTESNYGLFHWNIAKSRFRGFALNRREAIRRPMVDHREDRRENRRDSKKEKTVEQAVAELQLGSEVQMTDDVPAGAESGIEEVVAA